MNERVRRLCLACLVLCSGFDWPGQAQRLTADLAHAGPRERREIVRLLSAMRAEEARPALLTACSDPDAQVRREAMRAVARLSEQAAIPILLKTLNDADPSLRAGAADALGDLHAAQAEQALSRVLADSEATVRRAAVRALATVSSEAARGALVSTLDDIDVEVRIEAVRALRTSASSRVRDALLGKTRDSSPQVRAAALEAVAEADDPRAPAALAWALDDTSDAVALVAIRGLRKLAPSGMREWLEPLSHSPRTRVAAAARAAITAKDPNRDAGAVQEAWLHWLEKSADTTNDADLVIAGLERTLPAGEKLAFDPLALALPTLPARLRPRALALIARTEEPRALELFARLLDDPDKAVRGACARLLGLAGAAQHAARIVNLLDDTDRDVRAAAAVALGATATGATQAQLLARLVDEPNRGDRREGWQALGASLRRLRGHLSAAQREQLLGSLRQGLGRDEIAEALWAIKVLGELGDAGAVALLGSIGDAAPEGLRVAATRALQRSDHPSALRALQSLAQSESIAVRAAAVAGLGLVGSTQDLARIRAAQGETWPMGPVAAFALASLVQRGEAESSALCELVDAKEPITRANASAGLALKPCAQCPLPNVVQHTVSTPTGDGPLHTWRAVVLSDGRILIAYPDPRHEIDLPDLTVVAIESPWKMQYGRRPAGM